MPNEEKKEPSPYFPSTNDIVAKKPTQNAVYGGEIIPAKIAIKMLNDFKSTHLTGVCPPCEATFVFGAVSVLESIGFPKYLIQDILNEWQKMIKISPPDFLGPKG